MVSFFELPNPTRVIGLISFSSAVMFCGVAWIRNRGQLRASRLPMILAAFNGLLLLDIVLDERWRLHDLLEEEAISHNLYAQRSGPQLFALALLTASAVAGIVLAVTRLRDRVGAAMAICGAILSLGCWCVEVVSLHAVDILLYTSVKGIMPVSLIWIASSLMSGLGMLWESRALSAHEHFPSASSLPAPHPPFRDS